MCLLQQSLWLTTGLARWVQVTLDPGVSPCCWLGSKMMFRPEDRKHSNRAAPAAWVQLTLMSIPYLSWQKTFMSQHSLVRETLKTLLVYYMSEVNICFPLSLSFFSLLGWKNLTFFFNTQRLANSKAHTSRFISANLPCNKFKNRLVNIMPFESTRVCLQPIRGVEGSDYINASCIDGYR